MEYKSEAEGQGYLPCPEFQATNSSLVCLNIQAYARQKGVGSKALLALAVELQKRLLYSALSREVSRNRY